ncbi:MAG: branched-chain amino acid ABC transporter substrate-binding protein, partial [Alphaproteobacteria bacterium]|nr:branched-chain amino acid ABC transporter substrate-binding protein [Alphaproteobacteria bacterium]
MKKLMLSGIAVGFAAALSATTALADVLIATAGPITGQLAALGEQYRQGASKAVADINAAGGVMGEKLVLEIGDDACDPKQAVAVANQMAQKGVKFVAGHLCSGSSIPASKVYEEEGILQITPASTNPKFTDEGGWNVARVCGRDDAQGRVAGAFLAKNYAGKKVAVVDDKSAYGKGLADETRKAMNAAGLTEVLNESINAGEKDYSALVSKMKEAGVEAVYFGGYHPEAGLILKQMAEQGHNAKMLSGDAMNVAELWTIADKAALNLIFTFAPEPRKIPEAQKVVEEFKASGYDPESYTLYAYAAVQMYAQAATATGGWDNKKIAEWLRAGNKMPTVMGEIQLDGKGDLVNPV